MINNVKYILTGDGIPPSLGTAGSACYDLAVPEDYIIPAGKWSAIDLGIAFALPPGMSMHMYLRSSTQFKLGLLGATSIIDNDYHGNVHALLYNSTNEDVHLTHGQRIMQVSLHKDIPVAFHPMDKALPLNGRGGLGSTGL